MTTSKGYNPGKALHKAKLSQLVTESSARAAQRTANAQALPPGNDMTVDVAAGYPRVTAIRLPTHPEWMGHVVAYMDVALNARSALRGCEMTNSWGGATPVLSRSPFDEARVARISADDRQRILNLISQAWQDAQAQRTRSN